MQMKRFLKFEKPASFKKIYLAIKGEVGFSNSLNCHHKAKPKIRKSLKWWLLLGDEFLTMRFM
jgi:hypothetical protein